MKEDVAAATCQRMRLERLKPLQITSDKCYRHVDLSPHINDCLKTGIGTVVDWRHLGCTSWNETHHYAASRTIPDDSRVVDDILSSLATTTIARR